MALQKNISLKDFNTFGIEISATYFLIVHTIQDFLKVRKYAIFDQFPILILGGGSNILFTKNYDGIIIKNELKGISLEKEDDENVWIKASSGENWHDFVQWCVDKGYSGLENLSLIPGSVGAAPIQNIGAYGVELKEYCTAVEGIELASGKQKVIPASDCKFGYRDSIFKKPGKNKFFITAVNFKLNKHFIPNIEYAALKDALKGKDNLSIPDVSKAVIEIRQSKLPDPKKLGNAGSFFKNPEITQAQFKKLKKNHPLIVAYPLENGNCKIAAGWLIEQCGWKGKKLGNAAVHNKQALVLVNDGNASGKEIFDLSQQILESVEVQFGIKLDSEVNVF